jgi:hypothetical protein
VAAIAAGILVVSGALLFFVNAARAPRTDALEPLDLRTIPLAGAVSNDEPAIPAMLASYRPVADGGIQWVRDLSQANELASATGRPLLLYMRFKTCAKAERVEATVLSDERILALANECVPCVIEIDTLAEDQRLAILEKGYPYFELRGADGAVFVNLTSELDGEPALWAFGEKLRDGIEQRCSTATLPWELSRDLATLFARARVAESEQDMERARRFYEELVVAGGACGSFSGAGQRGIQRIALVARDALLDARALADGGNAAAAVAVLAEALQRFEGTPHAVEIARVLDALRRSGSFPPIAWASK